MKKSRQSTDVSKRCTEPSTNPKIDNIALQYSNTALSNRLDHMKRELATANLTCHRYAAICESYEFFIAQYFSGWKSFLIKLERINLLVKKQDNSERQTPKFTNVFESMADLISISNRLKEVADSTAAASSASNYLIQPTQQFSTSSTNAIKENMNHAMAELKKITRSRVESFVKMVENIYTEIAIDCAAANQRVNDTIKALASTNDVNDTMRRLYKENSQLQTKIKEQEKALAAQGSLVEAEKDILLRHFQQEANQITDLKTRIEESNEINEKLSLRLRVAMDYNYTSISAKTHDHHFFDANNLLPNNSNNTNSNNKVRRSNNAADNTEAMIDEDAAERHYREMEDEDDDDDDERTAELLPQFDKFECVCGGTQIEYFNSKFNEIHQARLQVIQHAEAAAGAINFSDAIFLNSKKSISDSAGGVVPPGGIVASAVGSAAIVNNVSANSQNVNIAGNAISNNNNIQGGSNSIGGVTSSSCNSTSAAATAVSAGGALVASGSAGNASEMNESLSNLSNSNNNNNSMGMNPVVMSLPVIPVMSSNSNSLIKNARLSAQEEISSLKKQKEELIEVCGKQEKKIRDQELDLENQHDRFFHSPLYLSLAAQTQELLRSVLSLRAQLKDAQKALMDISTMRYKEINELISKHHEEKAGLQKQLHDAREGVYRQSLGELLAENMTQHFDYKKYTQPLHDQLNKLSDSLSLQHQQNRSLEESKLAMQAAAQAQTKLVQELQTKLCEKEQLLLLYEAKNGNSNSSISFVDEKQFKYSKHKDIMKQVEKILLDLANNNNNSNMGSNNAAASGESSGLLSGQELWKGFREFIAYVKGREEKVRLVEGKLKVSETESKKQQSNTEEVWKEYESLEASFAKLKECCDAQKAELKKHTDREQELETKNLELIMKFQKEFTTHKTALAAEALRFENSKSTLDAMDEQNKLLGIQISEGNMLVEEMKALLASVKVEAEEANLSLADLQVQHALLLKKFADLSSSNAVILSDYEHVKARLQVVQDALDTNEKEQKNSKAMQGNTLELEKIKTLTSQLNCSCGERPKDSILHKCLHPFCRQCLDKQIKLSNKICTKCRTPFVMSDIKPLVLNNESIR